MYEVIRSFEMDRAEWQQVSALGLICVDDEESGLGRIALICDGNQRRWAATDSYQLGLLSPVADDGPAGRWLVPSRFLAAWLLVEGGTGYATLQILLDSTNATAVARLSGEGGAVSIDLIDGTFPDDLNLVDWSDGVESATYDIDPRDLCEAVRLARFAPLGGVPDDAPPPLMWLSGTDGFVTVRVTWSTFGSTMFQVPANGTGDVSVAVNPQLLHDLLRIVPTEHARLRIPSSPSDPIRLETDDVQLALLPIIPINPVRQRVEDVIASVFGPDAAHSDADGNYLLSVFGVPIHARVVADGSSTLLQVYSTVLEGVTADADLAIELNDLNAGLHMVRTIATDDRVIVAGDLVADNVIGHELITLFDRVHFVAGELSGLLAARFGGTPLESTDELRWEAYARTVVSWESSPGTWSDLSGARASAEFPFDGAVFVITAYNPFGRRRTDDENAGDLARLVGDIMRMGGSVARAEGRSADGDYAEPSVVAWGIDHESAIQLGAAYRQEAIFEITAETITVVGVEIDRQFTAPRITD